MEREPFLSKPLPMNSVPGDGSASRPILHHHPDSLEDSPAYLVLREHNLLETRYRLRDHTQIDAQPSNSTPLQNAVVNIGSLIAFPCLGPLWRSLCCTTLEVPVGHVRSLEDGRGGFGFVGAGIHLFLSPFIRVGADNHNYASGHIANGECTIVVVEQGCIGYATDRGQPVLLPPGLHQWRSPTLQFQRSYSLDASVIIIGPYTILTVDEGYSAVTQNNGRQEILEGGSVHLLTHKNWKFEKFMTRKIQTNALDRISVITGDNVLMLIDATVNWKIVDVAIAARLAAETMRRPKGEQEKEKFRGHEMDINKLQNDVLKQASASLSSFIGTVNYSDTFSAAAKVQTKPSAMQQGVPVSSQAGARAGPAGSTVPSLLDPPASLFDVQRMMNCVQHANEVTSSYGIEIISINIIQMKPADANLMNSLAQGAVAAAEAQQLETSARGRARAARIEAEGTASAEVLRAEGSKKAAELLEASELARDIERIRATGVALRGANSSMFFTSDPSRVQSLMLSNPAMVHPQLGRAPDQPQRHAVVPAAVGSDTFPEQPDRMQ